MTESYVLLPDDRAKRAGSARSRAGSGSTLKETKEPREKKEAKDVKEEGRATPDPSSDSQSQNQSQSRPSSPQGNRPRLAANLDALLSSRSNIDHPLCTECTGLFQAELQRELEELTRERDAYIAFERGLRKREGDEDALVGNRDEWDALVARRAGLEDEEAALRATLKKAEEGLDKAKEEEARVKADEEAVERDEAE